MVKWKCDISGDESEWVPSTEQPNDWHVLYINTNSGNMRMHICKECHDSILKKLSISKFSKPAVEEALIELVRDTVSGN